MREEERPLDNAMLAILSEGDGITMLVAVVNRKVSIEARFGVEAARKAQVCVDQDYATLFPANRS